MTEVATARFALLNKDGVQVSFVVPAGTAPDSMENLIDDALYGVQTALEKGFIAPAATQAGKAVANAEMDGLKEAFGIWGDNELVKCVSIDILPQPGGRTKVEYYGNSHTPDPEGRDKYPTVTQVWEPAKLQETLESYYKFKLETFQKAGSFAVDFYVETYKSDRVSSSGKPYTNLSKIHVMEGAEPPAIMDTPAPPPPPEPEMPDDIPF
jgi:hypothetical protein